LKKLNLNYQKKTIEKKQEAKKIRRKNK